MIIRGVGLLSGPCDRERDTCYPDDSTLYPGESSARQGKAEIVEGVVETATAVCYGSSSIRSSAPHRCEMR